jgi:hypothetical protein
MKWSVLLTLFALGGCVTAEEMAAQQAAADDAKCRSFGAQPGSKPYLDCRLELERNRANVAAASAIGSEAAQQQNSAAMMAIGARMMRGY